MARFGLTKENARELRNFFTLLAILVFLTFVLTEFIGLAAGGFETTAIIEFRNFYLIGGIYALLLIILKIAEMLSPEDKYGSSTGFASIGKFPHVEFFKRFTTLQLTLYSLIIFVALGLINFFLEGTPQSYTGVGFLESQAFTAGQRLFYETFVVAGAENFGVAVVLGGFLLGLQYLARRNNINKRDFLIYAFSGSVIIAGVFGLGNHALRYGAIETTLVTVLVFWALIGFFTVLTGSFIPGYVMHFANNFFVSFADKFSSDLVLLVGIGTEVILIIITLWLYNGRLRGESEQEKIKRLRARTRNK